MKFLFAKSRVLLHAAVLLFFLALAVFFFLPFLTGKLSFIWDTREFGFINLNIVTRSLSEGYFPFWNENNFSGYPFVGDIESGMFYPVNWLFAWIFGGINFSELVYYFIFHFFLGAVFAYVLAYKLTRNIFASALAGVVYAYSGYALGHISHLGQVIMYMWVPLVFWAYLGIFEKVYLRLNSKFHVLLAGLIFGIAMLIGHFNTSVYLLLGLVILTIYEIAGVWFFKTGGGLNKWEKIRLAINIGLASFLATVFAFMVAAISILPVRELALQSNRAELSYEQQIKGAALNPRNLLGIFNPNYNNVLSPDLLNKKSPDKFTGSVDVTQNYFYIGLLPVLFGAWFLLYCKGKYKWFWLIFGAISFAAVFPQYLPVNKWLFSFFPGFNKTRMAVQIMGMCFLAAGMITAMGAKDLAEKFARWVKRIKIPAFAGMTKGAGVTKKAEMMKETMKMVRVMEILKRGALVFLTALFLFVVPFQIFYHGFDKRFYSEIISPEEVFDLPQELELVSFLKNYPLSPRFLIMSGADKSSILPGLFRIADEENFLMSNKWEYYGLENVWGNGGIKIKKYDNLFERKNRLEWQVTDDNLYDFLNVRFVFTDRELDPSHFRKMNYKGGNFYLNLRVLPRAFWVEKYQIVSEEDVQLKMLREGKVDFDETVILNKKPVFYGTKTVQKNNTSNKPLIDLVERNFDYLKFDVFYPDDAFLVLGEVDYDGWKLFVDGAEKDTVTANYVFRAVPLAAGEHMVEFKYQPASVRYGSWISGFAVLLFVIGVFQRFFRFLLKRE